MPHPDQINAAAFAPGGSWFVAAGTGGDALWYLDRPYVRVLHGHEAAINGLAFAPDGSRLYTASTDERVREWPLSRAHGDSSRVLIHVPEEAGCCVATKLVCDPRGRFVIVAGWCPWMAGPPPLSRACTASSGRSRWTARGGTSRPPVAFT
jgi:WD40 repeat protein